MIRKLAFALSLLAILLGLGHLLIGAFSFQRLSFQALWFMGAGVAIVLGGMINLLGLLTSQSAGGRALLVIANLVLALFFATALVLLPAPQVFAGLLFFGGLGVLALIARPPQELTAWA